MTGEHVLVVDDEQDIREFLELALESEGYRVTTAENGAVALSRTADESIDLVLLDMRMPVMDGWAFADAYRRQPGHHARIVVITAAQDAAARAAQIQAEDYVAKPFDLDDLLNVLARHTRG
jgi:CheY-like chemotaxis protein